MMIWGEVFALASALSWALAVIFLRRSGERLPAFDLNLIKNLVGFALMIPTILLFNGVTLPDYSLADVLLVFISGLVGIAVADTWYLHALKLMGASRMGIVANLFSPFVILLSSVFLAEHMGVFQWLGFVLVMAGVLLVTWRVQRAERPAADVRKGAVIGVASILAMAIGVVMIKSILETRPFLWTVELRLLGGVAGMFVYVGVKHRWHGIIINIRQPQPWGEILLASFLAAYLSLILWLAGYKLIEASVASVLNQTNGTFIVFLAWLMLGEKISRRKFAGVLLTLGGVTAMLSL